METRKNIKRTLDQIQNHQQLTVEYVDRIISHFDEAHETYPNSDYSIHLAKLEVLRSSTMMLIELTEELQSIT